MMKECRLRECVGERERECVCVVVVISEGELESDEFKTNG